MQSRPFPRLPVIGILTVVYFIAGKLGLMLASLHASASPVWPAAGVAIAALLVLGYRVWPAIFIAAFLVNVTTQGSVPTSLGIAAGNTLESVSAAWLINRYAHGTAVFDRYHDVFRFGLAVLLAAIVSPTIGVTTLAIGGLVPWSNYAPIWLTWWLGDFSGAVIFTPVIVLWLRNPRRHSNPARDREVAVLLALLVLLSAVLFTGWLNLSRINYPVAFVLVPIIVWTAFRLSQRETASGILFLSLIAMWGTLHGYGPFVRANPNESLLILQSFNVLTTVTALALAAGMAERRRAEAAIEQQKAAVEA